MARERFRRSPDGYDRAEVDAAVDELDARLRRLEREAAAASERLADKEQRLGQALEHDGGLGLSSPGAIGALSRRLEEIYAEARRHATRMRMKALDDVVQASDRVSELARLRDELSSRVQELAGLAGVQLGAGGPPAGEPEVPSREGTFVGDVEVEVGPLADFAQLTGFEDAAAGIDAASEIAVKRFSGGRASFSITLSEPVELLRELEERAPFEFEVRATRNPNQLILDVGEPSSGEPRAA